MKIRRIIPQSLIDYPNHIAMVIFLEGCNFKCDFCFVKELQKETNEKSLIKEVFRMLKERKGFIDGVVITGGEPTVHKRLANFLIAIKKLEYPIRLYTNGSNPKLINFLIRDKLIDSIAVDIKGRFDNDDYKNIAKNDCTEKVRQTVEIIKKSGIDTEFRIVMTKDRTEDDIMEIEKTTGKLRRMNEYVFEMGDDKKECD